MAAALTLPPWRQIWELTIRLFINSMVLSTWPARTTILISRPIRRITCGRSTSAPHLHHLRRLRLLREHTTSRTRTQATRWILVGHFTLNGEMALTFTCIATTTVVASKLLIQAQG